jgi:chromosome partitioning protein
MRTWVIEAQKGGAGKTTIAVHMAVCAARRGLKTALIDIDPQGSAAGWNLSRPPQRRLDCVACTAAELAGYLAKARQGGVELVIVDTAPHSNADGAIAAQLADLVLIPCRPARFDLDAIVSTLAVIKAAAARGLCIVNAAPRGRLAGEAKAALISQGAAVAEPVLRQRAAYAHAVIDGRSVHEYEPNGAAAAEVDALYDHITGLSFDVAKKRRKAA